MYTKELNRVWGFMLLDSWKPKGEIFFAIVGGDTLGEHDSLCEKYKQKLLIQNEDDYTRWEYVDGIRREVTGMGATPYVTVLGFRVRDSY